MCDAAFSIYFSMQRRHVQSFAIIITFVALDSCDIVLGSRVHLMWKMRERKKGSKEGKGMGDKEICQELPPCIFGTSAERFRMKWGMESLKSGCSLAYIDRGSALSLNSELRKDFLKSSLRKPPSQEGGKSCSLALSHFLG